MTTETVTTYLASHPGSTPREISHGTGLNRCTLRSLLSRGHYSRDDEGRYIPAVVPTDAGLQQPATDEAAAFLRHELARGGRPRQLIEALAGQQGISDGALDRAIVALGVVEVTCPLWEGSRDTISYWRLP